jgi:ComEC/Rec2-related protein
VSTPTPHSRPRRAGPAPLGLPALGLLLGLLLGAPVVGASAAAGAAAALLIVAGTVRGRWIPAAAVLAAWVALGSVRASFVEEPAWTSRDEDMLVRVRILGAPAKGRTPIRLLAAWAGTPPAEPVPLTVGRSHLFGPRSVFAAMGRGSVVVTRARVRTRAGRTSVVVLSGAPVVLEVARQPPRLGRLVQAARHRVALGLGRTAPPDLHGLFVALVLGERAGLDPSTREHFARTGTAHLLAISGLHVGACMVLFWRVAAGVLGYLPSAWTAGGLPMRLGALVGLGSAALYVAVAGSPVSGRRALVMAAVVALAYLLRRRVSPWNTLAAACVCVLWAEPASAKAVGFQLSVVSVGGLLAWAGWISIDGPRHWLRSGTRMLAGLLWTGVIGTLATAPLVACIWGRVPLAGLWVNTAAVPLLGAGTIPPLLVGAALGGVSPVLGAPFVWLATWPARLGLNAVAALADPSLAPVICWRPAPVAIWALYSVVALAVVSGRER